MPASWAVSAWITAANHMSGFSNPDVWQCQVGSGTAVGAALTGDTLSAHRASAFFPVPWHSGQVSLQKSLRSPWYARSHISHPFPEHRSQNSGPVLAAARAPLRTGRS